MIVKLLLLELRCTDIAPARRAASASGPSEQGAARLWAGDPALASAGAAAAACPNDVRYLLIRGGWLATYKDV
eukprot:4733599-Pleurochrysis_carterae.AAC.1